MRKALLTFSIASILIASACSSDDPEVVVETDAGDITKEEFYEELKSHEGDAVLQQMVLQKVLEDTYSVDEEEVDENIEEFKEQYGDNFEMFLMQQGLSDEDDLRDALSFSLLYDEALYEGVEISDEEVEEAYERMKEEIEARHILLADEETAEEVKEKIDDGEDFAELAEEYSIDPGSAENGGDLDYFTALDMEREFEDAAYEMDVDEISDPVQTSNGFHIIQVTDRREVEDLGSFEEMEEEIQEKLKRSQVSDEDAQEKINSLLEDANIDVKISEFEDLFQFDDLDDMNTNNENE